MISGTKLTKSKIQEKIVDYKIGRDEVECKYCVLMLQYIHNNSIASIGNLTRKFGDSVNNFCSSNSTYHFCR